MVSRLMPSEYCNIAETHLNLTCLQPNNKLLIKHKEFKMVHWISNGHSKTVTKNLMLIILDSLDVKNDFSLNPKVCMCFCTGISLPLIALESCSNPQMTCQLFTSAMGRKFNGLGFFETSKVEQF